MASPFLHEDILMEIFSTLPVKSVGKFRCLSKTWRTNLSTSHFINLHLTTRKTKQLNLFLKKRNKQLYVVTLPIEGDAVSSKVELPITMCDLVDSCNGLVLLSNPFDSFLLVNPITLQHVKILGPRSNLKKVLSIRCGFGYDNFSDDYKIVMYYWYGVDIGTILQVYSLKSKVWKRVNTSPEHPITSARYKGFFINGAIHWASYDISRLSRIVAFNLTNEVFYDIPSPKSVRGPIDRLHVLEGCLCVTDRSCNDIWIMKEYGVEASWTKFTVGCCEIYKPLCFIGNEKIVLLTYGDRVRVYNLVDGTGKDIVVDGYRSPYTDGVAFFDSLVSLPSDQHLSD